MKRLLPGLLLFIAAATAAQERIVDFRSDVVIHANAGLTVTETIVVQVEGQTIQRGILRDFPTRYQDRAGNKVRVPFTVLKVTRDSQPENYATEKLDNGVRIRIGNEDVLLPLGKHTYTIVYRTARQLGFFETHDELYWNVTGNGWTFAIDQAETRVTLPRTVPAAQLQATAYTGPQGARGSDYSAQLFNGGAGFQTTRQLQPGEGLTIVLSFPKGIVSPPSLLARTRWFLQDNVGAGAAIGGLLLVCTFLYRRWDRTGRDPKPGPRFPRYTAPNDMSPAAVRFVDRMRADSRCFAAALLGLGARGYLQVDQHKKRFTLTRTGREVAFGPGEKTMCQRLFGSSKVVTIDKKYDPSVAAAQEALNAGLKHEYEGVLFRRNRMPLTLAGAAAVGVVYGAVELEAAVPVVIGTAVLLAGALLLAAWLLPAYSVEGRKLKDDIDGLRLYLDVAEGDDLARLHTPELTPEEFARQLPYALALDVEKTWADHFAAALGTAAVAAAVANYYSGTDFNTDSVSSIGALSKGLDSMSSTVSSASTVPGSDSGGGGSSGGGGGGGGGSGW